MEIQLKILQILSSLLTTNSPAADASRTGKLVQGEELGRVRLGVSVLRSTC